MDTRCHPFGKFLVSAAENLETFEFTLETQYLVDL